jgi:hypothetical protein
MLSSVSRSLGSVIFPVNAAAAAVSGYINIFYRLMCRNVLENFGAFLRLMVFVAGACPMPMHPIQPD